MTTADGMHPVVVNVGPCRCIGGADTPHPEGDTVTLKPELDVPMAMAANAAMDMPELLRRLAAGEMSMVQAQGETQYALSSVYMRYGIMAWSFVDEHGSAIPISHGAIGRLLPWGKGGGEVAEAADVLYSGPLFAPLVEASEAVAKLLEEQRAAEAKKLNRQQRRQMKKSSPNGRTVSSTSASQTYGDTPPEPSQPSLPASLAGSPSEAAAQ